MPRYAIAPSMRLLIARTHSSLSQQELGDKAGLSRNTISNIETGKAIELETLIAVSDALRVLPYVWLLPDSEWVQWLEDWLSNQEATQ